ncbi:hypothetical protein LZ32DRAFT_73875 [Colletotrichum eremochloae]|nr:hypothetical protein LZ32DRAFT_73875 [Colletotrichum eremochloae]
MERLSLCPVSSRTGTHLRRTSESFLPGSAAYGYPPCSSDKLFVLGATGILTAMGLASITRNMRPDPGYNCSLWSCNQMNGTVLFFRWLSLWDWEWSLYSPPHYRWLEGAVSTLLGLSMMGYR